MSVSAGFITVDFSALHNARIQNRFPAAPEGNVVLGGVPFAIPVGGNNEISTGGGENFNPANNGTYVYNIPVGIQSARTVYTLMSTMWGTAAESRLTIEFFGTGGAYYRRDLWGNSDVRDWNVYPAYTTTINGTTTVEVFKLPVGRDNNPDYVDMQIFLLPGVFFDQELSLIRLTDRRLAGVQSGILSGITVLQTPEPSTFLLMVPVLVLWGIRRTRR